VSMTSQRPMRPSAVLLLALLTLAACAAPAPAVPSLPPPVPVPVPAPEPPPPAPIAAADPAPTPHPAHPERPPPPPRPTSPGLGTGICGRPKADDRYIGYIRNGSSVTLRSTDLVHGEGCAGGFYLVEPRGDVCNDHTVTL